MCVHDLGMTVKCADSLSDDNMVILQDGVGGQREGLKEKRPLLTVLVIVLTIFGLWFPQ